METPSKPTNISPYDMTSPHLAHLEKLDANNNQFFSTQNEQSNTTNINSTKIEEIEITKEQEPSIEIEKLVDISSDFFCQKYKNVKCLPKNDQVHRLQTIIRDIKSSRSEFCFAADRLIRLVIEAGLDLLPITNNPITTPGGYTYEGSTWIQSSCGVSIIRSGEAMEIGLRDCCRSIRIGKVLIQTDEETEKSVIYYSKFPPLVHKRIILLMYPILNYDSSVSLAVEELKNVGVKTNKIILLTLFCTPNGVETLSSKYPDMTLLTSEISSSIPTHFSTKYFGTS